MSSEIHIFKNKSAQFVNNIVYNWAWWGMLAEGGITLDIIGNLFKQGPAFVGITIIPIQNWAINWSSYENSNSGGSGNRWATGDPSIYVAGNKDVNNWTDPTGDQWAIIHEVNEVATGKYLDRSVEHLKGLVPQSIHLSNIRYRCERIGNFLAALRGSL